jgi:hypothetical protein
MASSTSALSTELAFLLEREKVSEDFKGKLVEFGVTTIPKFAALVDTQVEVRELLKEEFGLDSKAGNMKMKADVSAILVAWGAAKKRADKQAEFEGEAEVRNEPKRIPVGDHMAMKDAFEKKHWRLEDEMSPCKSYLEKKLEMVEKDDLRAELLSEVLCVRDEGEDTLKAVLDSSFNFKAIKVSSKIDMPANAEQLRRRISVMAAAWSFVASSHSSRAYLKDMDIHIWTEYVNYLLGKFVAGILGGEDGSPMAYADWEIILNYEQEVRREMISKMQRGTALPVALRAAWSDPIVKDRYLITPLQRRSLRTRPRNEDAPWPKKPRGANKDKDKGKGGKEKGKGKGSNSLKSMTGCASTTKDGNRICFAYNNKGEGCKKKDCAFTHCCGICFKKGVPLFDCRHEKADKS